MNKRKLVIEINGRDVSFNVDLATHNAFMNGVSAGNKVQPAHNLVMACCADEDKDFVRPLLKGDAGGAVAIQIAAAIDEAYSPEISIVVKKPKSTQTESAETG